MLIFVVFLSKHVKLGNKFCENTLHTQISSHRCEAQFYGSFIFCQALTYLVFPSLAILIGSRIMVMFPKVSLLLT